MAENDELERETEFDDLIQEAGYNAFTSDGKPLARSLRYELRKRGLCIANDVPVLFKVKCRILGYKIFGNKLKADSFARTQATSVEPLYAAIS